MEQVESFGRVSIEFVGTKALGGNWGNCMRYSKSDVGIWMGKGLKVLLSSEGEH